MLKRLTSAIMIAAALGIASGTARAAIGSDESSEAASPDEQFRVAEEGNPYSPDYRNRSIDSRSPTSAEIDALESENPDAVRTTMRPSPVDNDEAKREWLAAESGNPHEQPVEGAGGN